MTRIKAPFKYYEGSKVKDRHIRLTKDMLMSPAYISLSYSAKVIYSYMKMWACGEVEFEYSWRLASKYVGSSRTYSSSKNELIEKGFIECIRTSKCSRYPNKYKFINRWHYWPNK